MAAIDKEEAAKRRKEEARNSLEGYLYRVRDLLEDGPETPFMKCSQKTERTAMGEKLEETFRWLHDHGDDADTVDYILKRTALEYVLSLLLDVTFVNSPLIDLGGFVGPWRSL